MSLAELVELSVRILGSEITAIIADVPGTRTLWKKMTMHGPISRNNLFKTGVPCEGGIKVSFESTCHTQTTSNCKAFLSEDEQMLLLLPLSHTQLRSKGPIW